MEPQLGVVEEIEHSEGRAFVLRSLADVEVALAPIEPRKGIAGAIVLQELELV
jgi:hypothetical protein